MKRAGKRLAIGRHTTDRNTAEAHAVVALCSADETETPTLAARLVVSDRDLQASIDRLGARVCEKSVIEITRRSRSQFICEFERFRVMSLKGDCIIKLIQLRLDRLDDLRMAMAGVAAPQTCQGIENLPAVRSGVVKTIRAVDQPRVLLEIPVVGEWHPQGFQIGHACGRG